MFSSTRPSRRRGHEHDSHARQAPRDAAAGHRRASRLPSGRGSVHAGEDRRRARPLAPRTHANRGRKIMQYRSWTVAAASAAAALLAAGPALAQKQGGTLRMYIWDNPPSASIHEEATVSTTVPFMSIFNNLVLYDQHKKLNTMDTIQPELATSWAWDESKTKLTFKLRNDVKWHDGKPFTAKDVVCTLDKLQEKGTDTVPQEPAQDLVAQSEGGDDQRRPRGDVPPRPAAGVVRRAVRHRLQPGLSLSRVGGRHAHQAGRHGPLQVRRVQEQQVGQGRAQPRLLARRATPTSTPSTGASSPTARRACWPSSPASST